MYFEINNYVEIKIKSEIIRYLTLSFFPFSSKTPSDDVMGERLKLYQ